MPLHFVSEGIKLESTWIKRFNVTTVKTEFFVWQFLYLCSWNAAGIDYNEVATEIIFAPFEQLSCTNISIIDNHIVGKDGLKSFTVELSSDYRKVVVVEGHATAQVSILENDGMHAWGFGYNFYIFA